MRNIRNLVSRIFIVVLVAIVPLTALAANEVGKMNGGSAGIDWSVSRNDHESIVLTVQAPDGTIYQKTFNGGQSPNFRTSDMKKSCVDGTYSYELRVVPRISGQVKAALAQARAAGDDAAVSELMKQYGLDSTVTQSGAFGMLNCSFLDPNAVESDANDAAGARGAVASTATATTPASGARRPGEVAVNDQVIPDDLIVQSSTCTGFDCVDGESFGFDTFRLKENNLRIHFEDTSTSSGYPANDWRLVANDSGSGGANKFVIEDSTAARNPMTIEAGAPANSIYVDSTGNIGFQQSAPGLDLHLTTSDTPALRLEQTNAGGFSAQTWDIGANEANFFVRDLTGGSRLSFRIRPGAPTSSIDIAASGNVGIGTASPAAKLHVNNEALGEAIRYGDTANNKFVGFSNFSDTTGTLFAFGTNYSISSTGTDQRYDTTDEAWAFLASSRSSQDFFRINRLSSAGVSTNLFHLSSAGSVGIGTTSPSSKLHVNGGDIRVSGGSFIDDGVTLVAPDYVFEESYKLMPIDELASYLKDQKHLPNVPSAKEIKAKGLNMSKFQMNLLEKVEELHLYTVQQHEQISSLKAQNEQLMERLAALEAKIGNKQ